MMQIISKYFESLYVNPLLNLIYPHDGLCLNCGQSAIYDLCEWCQNDIEAIHGVTCTQCGISAPCINSDDFICYECSQYEALFAGVCAFGYYEGTLKKMILDLKYHRKTYFAKILANMLANRLLHTVWIDNIDFIVPVPLSKERRKTRGFNQMDLIGNELSKIIGVEIIPNGLIRKKDTKPLKGLHIQERVDTINKAFAIGDIRVLGSNILLIDDVFTTGSTLRECAKILLNAGTINIYSGVVARAYDK